MKTKKTRPHEDGRPGKEKTNNHAKILFYDYIKIKGKRQAEALSWGRGRVWIN